MNVIAIVVLAALIGTYLVALLADVLNLNGLKSGLPPEFTDVYDAERYRKSQVYLRATTRFGWVSGTFHLVALLVFWFAGGFPLLERQVLSLNQGSLVTGLIYMGSLVLLQALLALPFRVYNTFVIEERFGFNKTTWKTFVVDMLKAMVLGALLGLPLLAGILAFFQYAGSNAWWYCWIATTLFMLVVQFVAPTWIMPLFNKFTPIDDGELKSAIMSYARSIRFPLKNVFVMDGSKRSTKANAFFTGFGKNKRIVLFDTLINHHTVAELVAVLGHEMGHYKKRHIFWMLVFGVLQMGIVFYLLSLFLSYPPLFRAFYMETPSIYAGLIFFSMLYAPIDFFAGLLMQMMSRRNEYAADRFAVTTTRDNRSLIDALKKLSARNLSNLTPHPLYVFLNYSHPPVLQRIHTIGALETD